MKGELNERGMLTAKNPLFLDRPSAQLEEWVQLIDPSFAALLTSPFLHGATDLFPLARTHIGNDGHENVIFLVFPSLFRRLFLRHAKFF